MRWLLCLFDCLYSKKNCQEAFLLPLCSAALRSYNTAGATGLAQDGLAGCMKHLRSCLALPRFMYCGTTGLCLSSVVSCRNRLLSHPQDAQDLLYQLDTYMQILNFYEFASCRKVGAEHLGTDVVAKEFRILMFFSSF